MSFNIINQDITKVKVDAIVNAANNSLLGGGGVDGCIHQAAGPRLLEECRTLGGCETGNAKATQGYDLPCRFVIHTVGPIWYGGNNNERALLESCYNKSLEIAKSLDCESIAFPLISSGAFGYPKDEAFDVAVSTIRRFLENNDMKVYLCLWDRGFLNNSNIRNFNESDAMRAYSYQKSIEPDYCYIQRNYSVCEKSVFPNIRRNVQANYCELPPKRLEKVGYSLDDEIRKLDKSFIDTLIELIDEKGMTDAECYKRANIDRKHFSKMRNTPHYRPSKETVFAFSIALKLNIDETDTLLSKAGFAFSPSIMQDVIVRWCIENRIYDIYEVNVLLFKYDQKLLGSCA